jgi:hypothetical protein
MRMRRMFPFWDAGKRRGTLQRSMLTGTGVVLRRVSSYTTTDICHRLRIRRRRGVLLFDDGIPSEERRRGVGTHSESESLVGDGANDLGSFDQTRRPIFNCSKTLSLPRFTKEGSY